MLYTPKGRVLSMHWGGSADRTLKICTCEHSLQSLGAARNEEPHALRCVFSGFAWQRSLADDRGLHDLAVLLRALDLRLYPAYQHVIIDFILCDIANYLFLWRRPAWPWIAFMEQSTAWAGVGWLCASRAASHISHEFWRMATLQVAVEDGYR